MERLSLINYDVLRELCDHCRRERFHFVPIGAEPATGECRTCGAESRLAELSETAITRLVTRRDHDLVIVPLIA
ncbi:MAG TPA: hypothetical protein VMU84_00290 [Thermoanaerobaculia bacterium]|nr:hypothetical protein [Thermoanaerobaculia bacterium]